MAVAARIVCSLWLFDLFAVLGSNGYTLSVFLEFFVLTNAK